MGFKLLSMENANTWGSYIWGSNYSVWKALTDGKRMKSQLETGVKVKRIKLFQVRDAPSHLKISKFLIA